MSVKKRFRVRLEKEQWNRVASGLSNMGQAAILFGGAAFFVPESVGLTQHYSRLSAILFFGIGLLIFSFAVIITKKEE